MSEILGTGYDKFRAACRVEGLAKEDGDRFDVLAVVARNPGTGQFREFVRKLQSVFATVCVWEDWSPAVGAALERYGFKRTEQVEPWGEKSIGWRWDAAKAPNA